MGNECTEGSEGMGSPKLPVLHSLTRTSDRGKEMGLQKLCHGEQGASQWDEGHCCQASLMGCPEGAEQAEFSYSTDTGKEN